MEFRLSYRRYTLAFRQPVRTAHGPWAAREGLYVRLERPDGSVGYGEAAPIPQFGTETADEAEKACRALGSAVTEEAVLGLDPRLCSLRNALQCAVGGGTAGAPVRPSLGVAALLPAGRAALAQAPARTEQGFRVFKWKVGVGAADDEMAMFDDLLAGLPGGSRVRLDANGAWDRRTAERWLACAADRPVEFIEQPVAPESKGAEDCLVGLAADYPVPIALDESIAGDGDVERWLGLGWPGYFIVKPVLMGDIRGVLGRLAAARARVVFSSALETALGAQSALQRAFAWPGEASALGFGVWPLFSDARFDGPVAAPFIHAADVDRIEPEALWNALA